MILTLCRTKHTWCNFPSQNTSYKKSWKKKHIPSQQRLPCVCFTCRLQPAAFIQIPNPEPAQDDEQIIYASSPSEFSRSLSLSNLGFFPCVQGPRWYRSVLLISPRSTGRPSCLEETGIGVSSHGVGSTGSTQSDRGRYNTLLIRKP